MKIDTTTNSLNTKKRSMSKINPLPVTVLSGFLGAGNITKKA